MKHPWMNAITLVEAASSPLPALVLLLAACLAGPGCTNSIFRGSQPAPAGPPSPATAPAPAAGGSSQAGSADYLSKTVVRDNEGGGAVENLILLNQKLTYTQEKVTTLQTDNGKLALQTAKQAEDIQRLRTDLALAQKELTDANDLLKEMRQSLDKWKADVLGFRDEMRSAQKAQLDAMAKVLTLLTGESPPAPAPPRTPSSKGASSAPAN